MSEALGQARRLAADDPDTYMLVLAHVLVQARRLYTAWIRGRDSGGCQDLPADGG